LSERASYPDLLARLDSVRGLGVDLGLGRIQLALARLGDPQLGFGAVQIAGTNGKGSTAAMAEAIFRAAGLRTGLFTSPHLARFTERIRVNGAEADGDRLAALDARVAATGVRLTYFEIATALGFLYMAEQKVEIAVLETGLGGRFDAVTACAPAATAVTSIALDHTEYLGGTIREIAREKAGVIKPGVPHLIGPLPAEAEDEMVRAARAAGAPLLRYGRDFGALPAGTPLALAGAHQRANAAVAVALVEQAARRLGRVVPEAAVTAGLAGVRWPGRLESIGDDIVLDCAHNPEGAAALAAALPALAAGRPVVLVVSLVRDKDAEAVLGALAPLAAAVVATRSASPRALSAGALAEQAGRHARETLAADDPRAALVEARRLAGPAGLIVITGSIFLVGELRAHLLGEPVDPRLVSDPV
jgi:dihydrofolate synthase/folylpolyglutamate synthase